MEGRIDEPKEKYNIEEDAESCGETRSTTEAEGTESSPVIIYDYW
jgi:hypothetical protein